MGDDELDKPAGPDRLQQFNAARLLIVSLLLIVVSAVSLVAAISGGGNVVLPAVLLVATLLCLVLGVCLARRHLIRRGRVNLDARRRQPIRHDRES